MMQQTTKYKLNLIETSDAFSPAPLNENMEKVEAAITAEAAARQSAGAAEAQARAAAVAALDLRLQTVEGRRVAAGYSTTGGAVTLGFTPIAVVLQFFSNNSSPVVSVPERPLGIAFVEGGFIYTSSHTGCSYIAFS